MDPRYGSGEIVGFRIRIWENGMDPVYGSGEMVWIRDMDL